MNILFYTDNEVCPQQGGTERITSRISTALHKYYGVNCYSVYSIELDSSIVRTPFKKKKRIIDIRKEKGIFYDFIAENNIDIVVNQGTFSQVKVMREVLDKFENKHLIFVHHFNPGAELRPFSFVVLLLKLRNKRHFFKNTLKIALYPFLKYYIARNLPISYQRMYENVDRVVLLSYKFKKDFLSFAHIEGREDKIRAIHNALSFDSFFDMKLYNEKKKEVLIVSRLEERQKRIFWALRIWQIIERYQDLNDWSLKIVGHGIYEPKYREFVYRNNLCRVFFEGIQQPEKYYREASLFMLTSSYEGWGITLTEAQQYGCVPLAFNSYASLTDIITDSKNGFIIPNNNINKYAEQLIGIMRNYNQRKEMAQNAIESSKRFEVEVICEHWMSLFDELFKNLGETKSKS